MLTQKRLKELFHYDPETGEFVRLTTPNNFVAGKPLGGSNKRGSERLVYRRVQIDGKNYYAHQLAHLYMAGEFAESIDHIDGDGLNNKWANLRSVSRAENMKNQAIRKNNTSGLMGVHFVTSRGVWQSRVNNAGRRKSLGYFTDFFEAVCARKSAENDCGYHENHGRAA